MRLVSNPFNSLNCFHWIVSKFETVTSLTSSKDEPSCLGYNNASLYLSKKSYLLDFTPSMYALIDSDCCGLSLELKKLI